jgi:hypothetical protein
MNNQLKDRVFDVPQNILNFINHTIKTLGGEYVFGIERGKKLLSDKTVTYGQLKRIIHDISKLDPVKDSTKYKLLGGDLMKVWSKQFLNGERNLVSNRKDSRKQADDIGSITGQRANSHLKTHSKKVTYSVPTNIMKSNSETNSISSLKSGKLFEEIEKIKKLIIF